jgi:hypothetical protein
MKRSKKPSEEIIYLHCFLFSSSLLTFYNLLKKAFQKTIAFAEGASYCMYGDLFLSAAVI